MTKLGVKQSSSFLVWASELWVVIAPGLSHEVHEVATARVVVVCYRHFVANHVGRSASVG